MTLSDRIAVMRDGKVVQYGPQSDIYRSPADTYVATFIGKPQMSLVPGALEQHESGVDFIADGIRLPLGTAAEIGLQHGAHSRVLAGFRAEHVTIAAGTTNSGLTFPARVELVEPTGSDTFVELECHGTTLTARVPPDLPVGIGDHVTVEIKPGSVHLFDAGSTLRIAR
jgi:multiple sugar transport system ATP-binding protein